MAKNTQYYSLLELSKQFRIKISLFHDAHLKHEEIVYLFNKISEISTKQDFWRFRAHILKHLNKGFGSIAYGRNRFTGEKINEQNKQQNLQ